MEAPMKRTTSDPGVARRLSVGEAARTSGKASSTIRRWIADGSLKAIQNEEGWYLIAHEDLMATLSRLAPPSHMSDSRTTRNHATYTTQAADGSPLVRSLQEAVAHERQVNGEFRQQIRTLEGELVKLNAEVKALLSRDSPTGVLSRWVKSKISQPP